LELRNAAVGGAAKGHAGAPGAPLDLEIAWAPIQFSDTNPLDQTFSNSFVVGTAGITASLSVGYALWSVRAASLLSTLVSSMPAWQTFDPLPVIEFTKRDSDDDDDGDDRDELPGQLFGANPETP
jgi:hypothetical protein